MSPKKREFTSLLAEIDRIDPENDFIGVKRMDTEEHSETKGPARQLPPPPDTVAATRAVVQSHMWNYLNDLADAATIGGT